MEQVRRAKLRYEVWDPERRRWTLKYKAINPDKKRKGNTLGESALIKRVEGEMRNAKKR